MGVNEVVDTPCDLFEEANFDISKLSTPNKRQNENRDTSKQKC